MKMAGRGMTGNLLAAILLLALWLAPSVGFGEQPATLSTSGSHSATALHMADFLLKQQNADGAIPDAPGRNTANEDSTMEYALMGLAAAYWHGKDSRYLKGLEKGLRWLAGREEMADPRWRGSWFCAYSSKPPYAPVPVSPGPGIQDVRGVDATSALFVYLLYQHSILSGSDSLAREYELHARAALDFILARNRGPDGFFQSSWHRWKSDGQWHLWPFRYAADQGDVYLGLKAGWELYKDVRYRDAAAHLATQVKHAFHDGARKRYALGLYEDGVREIEMEGFNGIFAQGYLPWIWGMGKENEAAYQWLTACEQTDGSMACYPGDPRYSLSAAIYGLAAASLHHPPPVKTLNWLIQHTYDPQDGGVRDTAKQGSEKYSNIVGFMIASFLGFPPFGR